MRHIPDDGVMDILWKQVDGAEKGKVPRGMDVRFVFSPLGSSQSAGSLESNVMPMEMETQPADEAIDVLVQ